MTEVELFGLRESRCKEGMSEDGPWVSCDTSVGLREPTHVREAEGT